MHHVGADATLDGRLNLLLDVAFFDGLEEFVEHVVLRVAKGELECVDLDADEDGALACIGGDEMDCGPLEDDEKMSEE